MGTEDQQGFDRQQYLEVEEGRTHSFQFCGLIFRRSIDSRAYTFPVVLTAAIAVWSLKTL